MRITGLPIDAESALWWNFSPVDTALRERVQGLLNEDKPSRGSKLREKVAKILRNEEKRKDQRTGAGDGGKPRGKVDRPLETADLNPTSERE